MSGESKQALELRNSLAENPLLFTEALSSEPCFQIKLSVIDTPLITIVLLHTHLPCALNIKASKGTVLGPSDTGSSTYLNSIVG